MVAILLLAGDDGWRFPKLALGEPGFRLGFWAGHNYQSAPWGPDCVSVDRGNGAFCEEATTLIARLANQKS